MKKNYHLLQRLTLILAFHLATLSVFSQLLIQIDTEENYPHWVDVNVRAYGFTSITTMQFALSYDQDKLAPVGLQAFNLPDDIGGQNVSLVVPGHVLVSWVALNISTGVSVPDGFTLFTVRFVSAEQGGCFVSHSTGPIVTEFTQLSAIITPEFAACQSVGILSGQLFADQDGDCSISGGDKSMGAARLQISSNGINRFLQTDYEGFYRYYIKPDDEELALSFVPGNDLWEGCEPSAVIEITDPAGNYTLDLGVAPLGECPELEIEIASPMLRRCFPGKYWVSYCNRGTLPVAGAEAVIEFDPFLEIIGSTLPWGAVSGNAYTFPLGDLDIGECGTFEVGFTVSCDAELGQIHCTEVAIFPFEFCNPLPAWDGAQLQVKGECTGPEVIFEIRNVGSEGMSAPSGYIVIEDDMIRMISPIAPLGPGEWVEIPLPANGATWRVEAAQVPAFPFQSEPSATVEACDGSGGGDISLGYAGMFSQDENAPHVAIDCQENIGSFDPNDKTAYPKGYRELHLIEPDVRLEYRIRFQNTGTDTAFKVVIVDTLSALLDPASLRLQAWSHPCELQILDDRRLIVDFPGILLPDSTTNEEASNGFVQFSIAQMPGNPLGEVIENRAGIYFDFNDPIITNEVFHTLGVDFIQDVSSVSQAPAPMSRLAVSPNPASEAFAVSMPHPAAQGASLQIYDANGRLTRSLPWNAASLLVSRDGLPPGLYWLALDAGGKTLAVGAVVLE
jgi:uncharacterized repeat protein (TIGR01451 family)